MNNLIDSTQFREFQRCPWAWYERYVNGYTKAWPSQQRDDAMAVGQLVHAAIEGYLRDGKLEVPPDTLAQINPTHDTAVTVKVMLQAYLQAYPPGADGFQVVRTEAPMVCSPMVAKVDAAVQVDKDTEVPDGLGGFLALTAGTWLVEHKTTSARTEPGPFIRRWQADKQADFQILTASQHLPDVRGVLVNVIQRPVQRQQYRTCRKCGSYTSLSAIDWGAPRCAACGASQNWTAPPPPDPPAVWRFTVRRTPEQLETSARHIRRVWDAMERMRVDGRESQVPNYGMCVDPWFRTCDFFEAHVNDVPVAADPNLVRLANPVHYLGLED